MRREGGGKKEGERTGRPPVGAVRGCLCTALRPHACSCWWHCTQSSTEARSRGSCASNHKGLGKGPPHSQNTVFFPATAARVVQYGTEL